MSLLPHSIVKQVTSPDQIQGEKTKNLLLGKWSGMQVPGQEAFMVAIFGDYQEGKVRESIIKK